jgi:4-hydroxy-tetrahydrodipicolinate reductase
VVAAIEVKGAGAIGKDAGELAGIGRIDVAIGDDPAAMFDACDAVLEFSVPAATVAHVALAAEHGCAHIIGTTGLNDEQRGALAEAGEKTVVVAAGNMSLGVNLLQALVEKVAAALPAADWDVEIVEMHHRHKVDAPSGTALMFGEAAASGRGVTLADVRDSGRDGETGAREQGAIGFAALRGGDVVGEHTVIFAGPAERVELRHVATDRSIFAGGAVAAALWAQDRAPGLYSMRDVLGL